MRQRLLALCLMLPVAAIASVTGLDDAAAGMVDLHGKEHRGEAVPVMRLGGQVGNGAEIHAELLDRHGSIGESAPDAKRSGTASTSAKLEKQSHDLLKKDLKLRQEVDSAKANVAKTQAERAEAVKKQQKLVQAEKKDEASVLKVEEKGAAKPETAASVRKEVKALTKDKRQEGKQMSSSADAKIATQNAKLQLKAERGQMMAVEEKEKVVKGRLNKSLKKDSQTADKAVASSADAREVKKVMKTKIAAIKDDFKERHKRDVLKLQKQRAKATTAMQQSALMKKNLQTMKTAISALKSQVETAESGASKDVTSAKKDYDTKVKKATAEVAAEKKKEQALREAKNTLSATVNKARKTLDAKNAQIAAEKLAVANLKGKLKVAQEQRDAAQRDAAEKLRNSEQATQRQKKRLRQEKNRASKRKQKIMAMKADNIKAQVKKADLQKIEKAHRKELTAIKVATKEQNARIQAQADDKAAKKAESKMQKKLAASEKKSAVETAKAKAATKMYKKELKTEAKLATEEKKIEAKDTAAIASLRKSKDAMKQHVKKVKELGVKAVHKAVVGERKKAAKVEDKIVKAARSNADKKVATAEAKQLQKMEKKDGGLMQQIMELKTQLAEMKSKLQVERSKLKSKVREEKKKRGELEVKIIKLQGEVRLAGACNTYKDEITTLKGRLVRQRLRVKGEVANAGAVALAKAPGPVCNCPVCKNGSESDDVAAKLKALQKSHDEVMTKHKCCKDDLRKAKLENTDFSRKCGVAKDSLKKEIDRLRGAKDSASKKAVKEEGKAMLAKQKAKDEKTIAKDEKAQLDAMGGGGGGDKSRLILRKVTDIEKKLKGKKGSSGGDGEFTPAAELQTCQKKLANAERKAAKTSTRASGIVNKYEATKTLAKKMKTERDVCNSKLMKGFTQEPKKPKAVPGPQGPSGARQVGLGDADEDTSDEGSAVEGSEDDDESEGWDAP